MPDFMPPVINPGTVEQNATAVVDHVGTFRGIPLRNAFLKSVMSLQRHSLKAGIDSAEPLLSFGASELSREDSVAIAHLMSVRELPPDWRYSTEERQAITRSMTDGIELVRSADVRYATNIRTFVGSFLFARGGSFLGGSVSDSIGTIWLAPPPNGWTPEKYGENVVHESIHQALFLDDLVRCIFPLSASEMEDRGRVTSAVLKRKRGYDKAFHSAYVALGIADYYRRLGLPWASELPALRRTIDELLDPDLAGSMLSSHGRTRLAELDRAARAVEIIASDGPD